MNAGQLAGGTVPDARLAANVARTNQVWLLGGNAGTMPGTHFLGTADNQPLELKVNNQRALRIEGNTNGAPNVIGGAHINFVGAGVVEAIIAGGGATNVSVSNSVLSSFGVVGGGYGNNIGLSSFYATIAGGDSNDIRTNSSSSVIGGGRNNSIGAFSGRATIAGGENNYVGDDSFYSAVGGGNLNGVADHSWKATIAEGYINNIGTNSDSSAIGGGENNNIASHSSSATIAGGTYNDIGVNSDYSAIGGGLENTIASETSRATTGGGRQNQIQTGANHATIGGGFQNIVRTNGVYATIPGGWGNAATNSAFAAGRRAKANHTGAFVWADSSDADFASTANNQFSIRASGGLRLSDDTPSLAFGSTTRQMLNLWGTVYGIGVQNNTLYTRSDGGFAWFNKGTHSNTANDAGIGGTPLMTLDSAGNLRTVTGTLSTLSDRNAKANFEPVNARDVLERVASLPITRLKFKNAPATQRHIGPMAQDFHAAFNVGLEPTGICTVDADGVALAAIQGLNQKLEAGNQQSEARSQRSESKIEALEAENAELKARLEKLEQLLHAMNGGAR